MLGLPQSGFLLVGAANEEVANVSEAIMTGVVGIFIVFDRYRCKVDGIEVKGYEVGVSSTSECNFI
jgi:hypothetical protein